MLSENDRKILQIMDKNLLMTTGELARIMETEYNGNASSLQRLMEMGYVEKVESIGTALVVTQKGMRAVKEDA